ncbi:DUF6093 family protein [Nocardioides aquiterrae]|uniref:Uncharacterized protein n=1 Tax=Nocardioides aquiterrae TaxID=203799 RepID=A0ABN1UEP3_9ACTN
MSGIDAAFLSRGIAEAAALRTDTCRITRPGDGERTRNPATGKYEDPEPVTVYEGPARIPSRANSPAGSARAADGGSAAWQVSDFPLDLPLDGPGYTSGESVGPGQTVTWLTSATDPELVGRVFGIVAPARQTYAVARRFLMREVVS